MYVIVNAKGMTMTQPMSERKAIKVLTRWQNQYPGKWSLQRV